MKKIKINMNKMAKETKDYLLWDINKLKKEKNKLYGKLIILNMVLKEKEENDYTNK